MSRPGMDVEVPDSELAYAVGLYALGEISEGRAAEIANVSRWRMRDILDEVGIEIRHGPRDDEELHRDVSVAISLGEPNVDGSE